MQWCLQLRLVGLFALSLLSLVAVACRVETPHADEFADLIGTTSTSVGMDGTSASTSWASSGEHATADTAASGGTSGANTGSETGSSSDSDGLEVCGDGVTEGAEECDDGEETATCDADCTFIACGDGYANVLAGEACDEGGKSAGCDADCTLVTCGDGHANALAGEECDEGGETAICDDDCTFVACGDGHANALAAEECDDGGKSGACDVDCTLAWCGDGTTNAFANEECDDAGESETCDVDCTWAECGDELANTLAGEACDDGGESATCDVDCSSAECGDGVFNASAGEQCDGAGRTAACDMDCTLASCGDGVLNILAGEACDGGGESATCNGDCSLSICGDGITNKTAGEECDDTGFSVSCDDDCTVAECGDALVNVVAGEQCDGPLLAGGSCQNAGFYGGALSCDDACTHDTTSCYDLPGVPTLTLAFSPVRRFDFSWTPVLGGEYYRLLESAAPDEPYVQLGGDIMGVSASFERPLHRRFQASYVLQACNGLGCVESSPVSVTGSMAEAVGYVKASNAGALDIFGVSVALSADGNTLVVGAPYENSSASGIDGDQSSNSTSDAGAVYVFVRNGLGTWAQQAYVKASNPGIDDVFGVSVALSADGNTLVVGARREDSSAPGINGDQGDDSAADAGAVYVFGRDGFGTWTQQAYVKASNPGAGDFFGWRVALSADGNTLAVGAHLEDGNASGIGGDQSNNAAIDAGAAYVFVRNGLGTWVQQAYVKASNPGANDWFGHSVALSADGNTLAVGAHLEDSNASGIGGDQANNAAPDAGAVYVFVRNDLGAWAQQAYVKASSPGGSDFFGRSVAFSADGNTLAIGAHLEDSNASGIGGDQANDAASDAGAVYVFVRNGPGAWAQQAYVKASNPGASDFFGHSMGLSADGNTLAVGAYGEDGNASGVNGDQANNATSDAGAVYTFVRNGLGDWAQRSYIKASNPDASDFFGFVVALSADGNTLAAGAYAENSNASGIGGDQANNAASDAGAVYLY